MIFSTQPIHRALINLKAERVVSVELQIGVVNVPYSILSVVHTDKYQDKKDLKVTPTPGVTQLTALLDRLSIYLWYSVHDRYLE